MQPPAGPRIGHLIVVFQKHHERLGWKVEGRGAALLLLPAIILALIQEPMTRGRDELLRLAIIIGVVGFVTSGQRDDGAMVKVVVDERVEAVAAALRRPDEPSVLRFVL